MDKKIGFKYNLLELVKQALKLYLDKYFTYKIKDTSSLSAMYEVTKIINDDELQNILEEWSKQNNDKTTLFDDLNKDCKKIWEIIRTKNVYKNLLYKYQKSGESGTGIFDETTNKFHKCDMGEHYITIGEILKENHFELLKEYKNHRNNPNYNTKKLDSFIENKLKFVLSKEFNF
jgi:hypothetical protein